MIFRFFIFILCIAFIAWACVKVIGPLLFGKAKFRKGLYDKYVSDEEEIADTKLVYTNKDKSRVKKEVDKFLKEKKK